MSEKLPSSHLPIVETGATVLNDKKEVVGSIPTTDARINTGEIDITTPRGELGFLVGTIENARRDAQKRLEKAKRQEEAARSKNMMDKLRFGGMVDMLYAGVIEPYESEIKDSEAKLVQLDAQDAYLYDLNSRMGGFDNGRISVSQALRQDIEAIVERITNLESTLSEQADSTDNPDSDTAEQIEQLDEQIKIPQSLRTMLKTEQRNRGVGEAVAHPGEDGQKIEMTPFGRQAPSRQEAKSLNQGMGPDEEYEEEMSM